MYGATAAIFREGNPIFRKKNRFLACFICARRARLKQQFSGHGSVGRIARIAVSDAGARTACREGERFPLTPVSYTLLMIAIISSHFSSIRRTSWN